MNNCDHNNYICHAPFNQVYIGSFGEVYICCPPMLPVCIGNILEEPIMDVWNSTKAQEIRRSVFDKSYCHCNMQNCAVLQGNGSFNHYDKVADIVSQKITELPYKPQELCLCHDHACNLTCSFCRDDFYKLKGDDLKRVSRVHNIIVDELLDEAQVVTVAGMGDPFVGKHYRSLLENFDKKRWPNLTINLITNGMLLTKDTWQSINKSHEAIDSILISVNAGTAKTYEINQKGAKFEKLLKTMNLVKSLRQTNAIKRFQLNFFVQQNNYRELPDFVRMAKDYRADTVQISHLFTSESYDLEKYKNFGVHEPNHPEHKEFLKVLSDPILKDPIVYMSTLNYLMPGFKPFLD
jgi:MoaA/NifB/PqqE/SkfB family radical SAM enzyme